MELKKLSYFLITATIIALTVVPQGTVFHVKSYYTSKNFTSDTQSQHPLKNRADKGSFYQSFLMPFKQDLHKTLLKEGVTLADLATLKEKELPAYFDYRESFRKKMAKGPLKSQEIIQLIETVFQDFGVNKNDIIITSYKARDFCPALTYGPILYIDEKLFKKQSLLAQKFIIAHELQHILNEDALYEFIAYKKWGSSAKFDHPYNSILRFHEMRADLGVLTKSSEYAQGQLNFLESIANKSNNHQDLTHPPVKTRIEYGKKILEAHKEYSLTPDNLSTQSSTSKSQETTTSFYTEWIKQEETNIWTLFEENNFSKKEFNYLESVYLDTYYPQRDLYAHHIPKGPTLSAQTLTMIKEVLKDFNIAEDQIGIISYIDQKNCPAHTDDINLFIDEQLLLKYTPNAQRFIIAHELQHFLHNDDSCCFIIEKKFGRSNSIESPYNILNRFQEMRADLGAITKSDIYLKGQQEFLESVAKKYGQGSGITHPKISLRFDLGQKVLALSDQSSKNISESTIS